MGFIGELISGKNHIQMVEVLTILGVLVVVGYCFYSLNLFKKG
jgi:hypothetical protein